MSAYNWQQAEAMFAAMTDAELAEARARNIARRDALDHRARLDEDARTYALAALKAAQEAFDTADRLARDSQRAYSHAADDCCMGANEALRRTEAARATLARLGVR